MSFMQPCLLLILTRDEGHGYSLVDDLAEFGFNPDRCDPSLIYRALREMESEGWVTSRWDTESQGPRRRMYQITQEGEDYLQLWVADLRRIRQEINAVITAYEQIEAKAVG
jgi:poly-beta-hydroxybutyrate-responsive repressor